MRMYVILVIAVLLAGAVVFSAYRVLRMLHAARDHRAAMAARLAFAAARAEQQHAARAAADEASDALTTVLPAIQLGDRGPRRVA